VTGELLATAEAIAARRGISVERHPKLRFVRAGSGPVPPETARAVATQIRSVLHQRLGRIARRRSEDIFRRALTGRTLQARVVGHTSHGGLRLELLAGLHATVPPGRMPERRLRPGQWVLALCLGPWEADLSSPDVLLAALEAACPELGRGEVEIVSVARMAGRRSKVAVKAPDKRTDPVKAVAGDNGSRLKAAVALLGYREAVDVVRWSPDPIRFVKNALKPAVSTEVRATDDGFEAVVTRGERRVALGRGGENVRLAEMIVGRSILVVERGGRTC
jgi:transcription antitermination factor NusA-like protein